MKKIRKKLVALIEELYELGPKESSRTHLSLNLAILALKNGLKHVAEAQSHHDTDMGGKRHPTGDDDDTVDET